MACALTCKRDPLFVWYSRNSIVDNDKHVTERWPPGRDQLDNYLSNTLPDGGEHVEDIQAWYRQNFESEFKPRTRILSLRLPYEDAKQGQYASDKVEFVIVKDHKNRTANLAAKEVPKVQWCMSLAAQANAWEEKVQRAGMPFYRSLAAH
jgi:hypothetical protein